MPRHPSNAIIRKFYIPISANKKIAPAHVQPYMEYRLHRICGTVSHIGNVRARRIG